MAVIVLLHGLLGTAMLWWSPMVELATAGTPLQVQLLSPVQTPAPPAPSPRSTPLRRPRVPQGAWVPVPEVVVVVSPPPAPSVSTAPAPPSPPVTVVATPTSPPSRTAVAPAAPAAPPRAPAVLPPSAIQYLALPDVDYPAVSRRLNETGLVVVAVWVDTHGLPQQVQLAQSSGFERLDRAALEGVRRARFKPYVLNGRATAGWARIPIPFELTT